MAQTHPAKGVVIRPITRAARLASNIYCERPFCSADSKRLLYLRQLEEAEHQPQRPDARLK